MWEVLPLGSLGSPALVSYQGLQLQLEARGEGQHLDVHYVLLGKALAAQPT
jgi:hypothetical protein